MFVGESLCFGLLFIKRRIYGDERKKILGENAVVPLSPGAQQAQSQKKLVNINPLWLAIPAACDFTGSTLMFVALTMVPASVYQMMRGAIVIITALFSVCFLGRKLYKHHWWSILIIFIGVAEVGWVSTWEKYYIPSTTGGSELMGISLLIASQCFTGIMFIVEEKLLSDYYLDPFVVVGHEGMWGLMFYLFVLPIMQCVHCGVMWADLNNKQYGVLAGMCNYNYLENSAYAFYQMGQNPWLVIQTIISMFSIASFNGFGIATTKYASAAQRSTIDTSRTALIWFFSCILLGAPWELPSLIGFAMLVFGTLVFNEIVVLEFWGFDENTAAAIAKRKRKGGVEDDMKANYVSLSPHAAYDTQRNQRNL